MVVFEVTFAVPVEHSIVFESWFKEHVREVLLTDGFESASVFKVVENEKNTPGCAEYCCQFHVASTEQLNYFFANIAPSLRAKRVRLFGDKIQPSRRVLTEFTM